MNKSHILIFIIILASFALAFYFYPQMPEKMASHWNSQGQVDGFMPKFWGLFLMPFVVAGLFLLFLWLPRIDPLKANIQKFRKYYNWFIVLIILFFFYIYLLTIFWNLGMRFNMSYVILPAVAGLFYFIGILLKHAKRNWFIGIRTPWTLSSDIVWEKVHKIGSKLFQLSALIALFGLLFLRYAVWFLLVPIFSVVIYLVVLSYFEYQKEVGSQNKI